MYDVIIVGGGPAGLSAALALGRARRRVLLCDAGTPRNAAAHQVHNFVTRDGTPPAEFRHIAREELAAYASVEIREQQVHAIEGERGHFDVQVGDQRVAARRVLLCLGMVDVLPELPGYRELWGRAVFQCPYCHGWEARDRPLGYLARAAEALDWALLLRSWSSDLVVFTDAKFEVPAEVRARLEAAAIQMEERPIARLMVDHSSELGPLLAAVQLDDGTRIAREFLFAHPPQRQTELVQRLALALDEQGFVRVDALTRQTSRAGIYAAGDLITMLQAAIISAAAGVHAAAMLNHELALGGSHETHPA